MTFGYVLVVDLAYWYAHWIMHRMPAMWEFHKLHHSAQVMTPLTEWRQHPVELLLFPAVIALFMGAFYGAMTYLFGAAAQPLTWFNLNALMLAFMATTLHLRHSHFWLPATGWLGYVIQSPAHHQIHHSDQDRHYGKNLGLVLSVWDWAFGTLYIPNESRNRHAIPLLILMGVQDETNNPRPSSETSQCLRIRRQAGQASVELADYTLHGFKDAVGELLFAKLLPDMLLGIEFR